MARWDVYSEGGQRQGLAAGVVRHDEGMAKEQEGGRDEINLV